MSAGDHLHVLKCWPDYFEALHTGAKTFEVRIHDRDYQVGDLLRIREWREPEPGDPSTGYTGREVQRRITYLLPGGAFGVEHGYCVLGLVAAGWNGGATEEDA